ncbi:hypothetical protein DPSP01_008925 [Paraphaeosphaeria sporulosa]
MRLINCATLGFEEFIGKQVPPYLILSHTWETYEISYKDYCNIDDLRQESGLHVEKILKTCDIAKEKGYEYVWIDTCCIDKSSSAELTEAINSMFKWYSRAADCIVYLSDFDVRDPSADFARCRWFTRGWTLQELIAPRQVRFYDSRWRYYGRRLNLAPEISRITGIALSVISGHFISRSHSIAERMSWAAHRETTREEDLAYCLFGIFGVNLPLLYGEGPRAFMRLQEEILKASADLSIFAWRAEAPGTAFRGIFAHSVREFAHAKSILSNPPSAQFAVTNGGLRIERPLLSSTGHNLPGNDAGFLMSLGCRYSHMAPTKHLAIWLKKLGPEGTLVRFSVDQLSIMDRKWPSSKEIDQLQYIMRDTLAHED